MQTQIEFAFRFLCRLTFWSTLGSILGSMLEPFWEPSAALYSSWELWAWIEALFCCTLFSFDFGVNFGVRLWGVGEWEPSPVRGGGPTLCFLTFQRKTELAQHVFEVFRISGFPVSVRERGRERERERGRGREREREREREIT